ncbi:hypothetical protein LIA77_08741 [Sarocladium implicatum]|nr:hypothetical protein LIA77_08741 [Sarocladium implicatum]
MLTCHLLLSRLCIYPVAPSLHAAFTMAQDLVRRARGEAKAVDEPVFWPPYSFLSSLERSLSAGRRVGLGPRISVCNGGWLARWQGVHEAAVATSAVDVVVPPTCLDQLQLLQSPSKDFEGKTGSLTFDSRSLCKVYQEWHAPNSPLRSAPPHIDSGLGIRGQGFIARNLKKCQVWG